MPGGSIQDSLAGKIVLASKPDGLLIELAGEPEPSELLTVLTSADTLTITSFKRFGVIVCVRCATKDFAGLVQVISLCRNRRSTIRWGRNPAHRHPVCSAQTGGCCR